MNHKIPPFQFCCVCTCPLTTKNIVINKDELWDVCKDCEFLVKIDSESDND